MDEQKPPEYPKLYNYDENRALAISLLGGKCVVCGTTEALEIDHIRREDKEFDVSARLAKWTPQELMEELKKCQLLCHTHHMEKTIRERGQTSAKGRHGTLSTYRYCKCELCTKAHSDYCLAWKANRKRNKKRRQARSKKNESNN